MDITSNNAKLFSNRLFNVETVNYTAVTLFCFIFQLGIMQCIKNFFNASTVIVAVISFIVVSLISFFLEKKFVFTRGIASTAKQLTFIFRVAVDFGFFKVFDFLFGTVLSRNSSFVWLASFTVIFVFNYFYDRLIVFECIDKAEDKCKGRFYRFFFRNRFVAASAVAALICISFIFIVFAVFPFGDSTVMRMDLYHQYGPLFAELYDRVVEGKSFLYSWESGGGSSFLGNYFNYLSSPFSIIIFFFDKADISFAITTMVIVKCVFSAATFTFYLRKSLNRHSYITAAFGVFYAFSAYFLAYYWNIMWIDGMIWLPLIALGIEQIIKSGNGKLYAASLAILLFSNYYMGFMACVFSVIYFLAFYAISYKPVKKVKETDLTVKEKYSVKKIMENNFLNRAVRFAFYSVIAGAVCAATLIPTYILLRSSSATSDTFPTTFESYFPIFDFITSHLASLETTIRSSGDDVLPNVYCGMLALITVPLYLINKEIKLKEKLVYVLLLIFFLFSFDNNVMNFMWHAFHFPNDLPFRYSYMYTFILLVISFRGLMHIRSINYKDIMYVSLSWIFFICVAQKFITTKMSEVTIYVSIAFIIVWCGVLLLLKKTDYKKALLHFTLIAMAFCEVIVSDCNSMVITQDNSSYKANYASYTEAISAIEKEDKGFYRTELTYLERRMDPCYFGYNGMSAFSSMAYEDYATLQYNLGMFGNRINSYTYNPQTAVYNMMFNIKYLIKAGDNPTPSSSYFSEIYTSDTSATSVYRNDYCLPIAYLVNSNVNDWVTEEGDPFEIQGNYFSLATGYDGVFRDCTYLSSQYDCLSGDDFTGNGTFWFSKTESGSQYGYIDLEITPDKNGDVYVYITSPDVKSVEFSSAEIDTITQNIEEPYILDLGYHEAGETISVSIDGGSMESDDSYVTMYAYSIDNDVFEKGYDKLSSGALDITEWSDTKIEGTLTADDNCFLYTSIPYDDGWKIYIDGLETETFKTGSSMLTAAVKPGEHEIVIKYTPGGLSYGIAISGTVLAGIAGYYIYKAVKARKNKQIKKY